MNKFYFAQFHWHKTQAEKLSKFKNKVVTHVSLHYGTYSNNVTTMAITKIAQ